MRQAILIITIIALLAITGLAQSPKSAASPPAKASSTATNTAKPAIIPLDPEKMKTIGAFEPLANKYSVSEKAFNDAKKPAQDAIEALYLVDIKNPDKAALALYAFRDTQRALNDSKKQYDDAAAAINGWMVKVRAAHDVGEDYGLSDDAKSLVKREPAPPAK